ncbi:MAG: transcriptional repressor [Sphingobacteriales bacterium]|nr:transcriptional repressor [Sphingobacteriales bacterium]OJY86217.1 MAG: Fur family transcriptional regulator [Sphingobacteriales bacterium 44-15]
MRNTIARTQILDLITNSKTALSHAEIEQLLDGLCNRVTIYRVLERLAEDHLVHKIINVDGHLKFAACHNCKDHHHDNHVHFSCVECGSVTCLEGVEPVFKIPRKYKVQEMSFMVSGLCPDCA